MNNPAVVLWLYTASFRARLTLKPYGNNLLEPGAAFWISMARLIVLLTAVCEGLSWGYLGQFLAAGPYSYAAGVATFTIVFLLVWAVDATLLTLDTGRTYYHRQLYAEPERVWPQITVAAGFSARLGIATLSLVITAPFLANMVFDADIRKEIAAESAAVLNSARVRIEEKVVVEREKGLAESASVAERLAAKQADRSREVAGRGQSKRFGEGPVAKSIQQEIDTMTARLELLSRQLGQMDHELREFDQAVEERNYEKLSERWLVLLPENSIVKRGEVLKRIVATPTYTDADLAIKSFLGFLLGALVLMKVSQPHSIRIYYSEALQSEWKRYLAGTIDPWLSHADRSTRKPVAMTAFRFEDLMLNCSLTIREGDFLRIKTADARVKILEADATLAEFASVLRNQSGGDLEVIDREIRELSGEHGTLENVIGDLDLNQKELSREIVEIEKYLGEFTEGAVGRYGFKIARQRMKLEEELAAKQQARERASRELGIASDRKRFVGKRLAQTEARRESIEAQFREFTDAKEELKKVMIGLVRDAYKNTRPGAG